MFLKYKCLIILLLFLTGNMMTEAQELIAPTDTVMAVTGDTAVSAGQDKPVPVCPARICRVVVHMVHPQLICHGRASQGQPRMTGFGLLNRIR